MRNLNNYLNNKTIDYNKLLNYGFIKDQSNYIYSRNILNNQFSVLINISDKSKTSKLIDLFSNDEYILVDVENSVGEFVGSVRAEYESIIDDIISKCTISCVFKSNQTQELIKYISQKYNDNLEFLWKKYDNNAIWRNKKNNKWYGVLMTISEEKLGISSQKTIEVVDLKYYKDRVDEVIDNISIFSGYHMNKRSWITIKLDNSLDNTNLYKLVDTSYSLSIGNSSRQSDLSNSVFEYLTTIPKGKVVTYKQVAMYLGNPGLARVVGNILHANPDGEKYPCYKVVNSQGKLAESFVFGGINVQKHRLEKEGIKVNNNKVDLNIYQWNNS